MTIEKRSLAGSDVYLTTFAQPVWTKWTVDKGVKEGAQFNSWVYRAVKLITDAASSVPWAVMTEKGPDWNHPLSKVLAKPNAHYSRQKLVELLAMWMELAGTGYLQKVKVGNRTAELWPVSPDRIAPVPSDDPLRFIDRYVLRMDGKATEVSDARYTPESVICFKFTDPSNPYSGLSPLGAAARAVDQDNAQAEWNTGVMSNRGVPEGLFSFKQAEASQAKSLTERLMERISGAKRARAPLVLTGDATYTRMSLSPVELDYLDSRKAGRDEIFGVFGVPPQLGGAMESMTYNNYAAALRIMWEATVIPLLDNLKDSLNTSFADELEGGKLWIGYDLTNVAALKANDTERVAVAKTLFEIGVPVSIINERLELGIPEYPGWEVSRPTTARQQEPPPDPGKRSFSLVPLEQRSVDDEMKLRDDLAEGEVLKLIMGALDATRDAVFADVMVPSEAAMSATAPQWTEALQASYLLVATKIAAKTAKPVVIERRDAGIVADDEIEQAILFALEQEAVILTDLAGIHASTVQTIVQQVAYGIEAGWNITQIQQAILDTGIFSAERALVIARTTAGTAASIGQMTAGAAAGATHKVWVASHVHTRPEHSARSGEVVPMSGTFSARIGPIGPRYPLDPLVAAGDRINCRCYMTFEMR